MHFNSPSKIRGGKGALKLKDKNAGRISHEHQMKEKVTFSEPSRKYIFLKKFCLYAVFKYLCMQIIIMYENVQRRRTGADSR